MGSKVGDSERELEFVMDKLDKGEGTQKKKKGVQIGTSLGDLLKDFKIEKGKKK